MAPLPPTRERPIAFVPGLGMPGDVLVKRPSRLRRAMRLLFFFLAILLAVGLGAVAAGIFLTKHEINKVLTPKTEATRAAAKELAAPLPGQPANILIMGSDHRSGYADTDRRSDTLLMMRLDPKRGTASMLSFPRDLWVDIPGHGQSKINDAFTLGGPKLSVQTVKQLTGLDVNYIVVVDFKGFRQLINSFGGVYIDVDHHYFNDNANGENYATIDVPEGYQLLGGRDALDYARFRHTDSDFHRIARQQNMIAALKQQVTGSKVAGNVGELFNILYQNTDMATGGNGRISTRTVYSYLRLALDHKKGKFLYNVDFEGNIGTAANGASIVEVDETALKKAVNAFLAPDEQAQAKTAAQLTGEKDTSADGGSTATQAEAPAPKVPLEVKNGNGIPGSAGQTAVILRKQGYDVYVASGALGNADNSNYAVTKVQYVRAADKASAEAIAEALPGATVEPITSSNSTSRRVLVIVGKDANTRGTAPATTNGTVTDPSLMADSNKVPEKTKPAVTTDPQYALDEFQQLASIAGMKVLYPATRAQGSTFELPVRSYLLTDKDKHPFHAYRIVGRTVNNEYWGLQGTKWPHPPLLSDPTRSVTRGGRTYDLFFNGTKLHRVAWHQYGGTYWISNTVLDKLSNETMLAIAEGTKLATPAATAPAA
jgi:LCP family protein required for cell wall assembly